jgi:hypothetical protein
MRVCGDQGDDNHAVLLELQIQVRVGEAVLRDDLPRSRHETGVEFAAPM